MVNDKKVFRGVARNVEWREQDNCTVLAFRIEQTDDEGNVINYTPVELREIMIKGTLVDGDKIETVGEIDTEGILIPKRIVNLRTKGCITRYSPNKWIFIFFYAVGGIIIGSMIGAIIGGVIGAIIGGIVGVNSGEPGDIMVYTMIGSGIGSIGGSTLCVFVFVPLAIRYALKKYREKDQ